MVDVRSLATPVEKALANDGIAILPPCDVFDHLKLLNELGLTPTMVMLDPWYNKGVGGALDWEEYDAFIRKLISQFGACTDHLYLWGFPEIVARYVSDIEQPLVLLAWLTWYYKNNPSVIRGWRSAQMTCLHLVRSGARLYPEHFLNEAQKEKQRQGKLRYMPGPPSVLEDEPGHADVIEEPLIIGFVKKQEQTGHPAQKPEAVYRKLVLMVSDENALLSDPMAGSGTLGAVASKLGRRAILSDSNPEYVAIMENRLGIRRVKRRS